MNVFEFAMQMEKDGEAYYRELAAKADDPGLKKIFTGLADDEVKHYEILKKMHEKAKVSKEESNILESARNIFQEMKDRGTISIGKELTQPSAYQKALKAEEESFTFYERKAEESTDPVEKKNLLTFAREERRHYKLIENIIEFVSRPEAWLENAEFARLEEY
ncbi:ferritin-like domain-containing protein [Desulfosediminicola ganghwensis]|uniref:ferritin-like domain-containing protein n=1 Tax=Desulfosediminicola ganghwensis TaxID=2569540 RepID=UPI0010ADA065|nr:ferritin family protein [Desulfosediminicola ganghwensis]